MPLSTSSHSSSLHPSFSSDRGVTSGEHAPASGDGAYSAHSCGEQTQSPASASPASAASGQTNSSVANKTRRGMAPATQSNARAASALLLPGVLFRPLDPLDAALRVFVAEKRRRVG